MSLLPSDQKRIDDFFAGIEVNGKGYRYSYLSYFAIKYEDQFRLLRARVYLNPVPTTLPLSHFQSASVRAGQYELSDLADDPKSVLDQVLRGKIDTPDGPLWFPPAAGDRYATLYAPFSPDALQNQRRISVLAVMGSSIEDRSTTEIDWELKSAVVPYDTLQELTGEYGFGPLTGGMTATVEFAALNIAGIDGLHSSVSGDSARVRVQLAPGLDREKFALAYRVYRPDGPPIRTVVAGSAFNWQDLPNEQRGTIELTVPVGSVLNCVTSYSGFAQSHYWLIDPAQSQNPRRAVHEAFDPELATVRDIVLKAVRKGQEARDLESAVGWLLWMLGFSVANLGGIPRTQDAADLIAVTPAGHFAVVECTTGLLRADNKLPLLHDRTQAVRRALNASRNNHVKVLPAIVTSKSREEVRPDLEQAERLGILVVTRETLEDVIARTARVPAPDQLYDEAFQAVRAGLAKFEK